MAEQLKSLGVSVFCQDMAMMLGAGIMPEEAVGLLAEDAENSEFREILKGMEKEMAFGANFTTAIRQSSAFPDYACDMIATGERAGRLEQVLRSLAGYYERQDLLQRQLRNAVIYPVTLLLMMCAVLVLMVTLVLPVFVSVYENMTGALAQSSYRYITIASGISWVSLVVVGVLSVAVLVCFAMYRTESGKKKLYEMLQKLPATKGAVLQLEVSRLIDGLSTFLSSGMDTDTAMEEATRVVTHPVLKGKVDQITQEMQEGKGLAQALYDHKILPPPVRQNAAQLRQKRPAGAAAEQAGGCDRDGCGAADPAADLRFGAYLDRLSDRVRGRDAAEHYAASGGHAQCHRIKTNVTVQHPISLAEFAPAGANKIKFILGENRIFDQNTSRGANVRAKRVR